MSDLQKVANWMLERSYATGHGDTIEDLLKELEWQVAERVREACAVLCENMERNGGWITKTEAAAAIRERRIDLAKVGEVGIWGEKPPVKTYCGGVPNYCTAVDETTKVKYMDMSQVPTEKPNWKPGMMFPKPKREWVGLTDEEIDTLVDEHLVAVQEYIGAGEYLSSIDGEVEFARAIEAKLKEKNT